MVQPGRLNIIIQQGADWSKDFQLFDSVQDPVNLTGSTVEAEIWTEKKTAKLADFTVTVTDAALGKFTLSLSDVTTADIQTSGYYDIKITNANGLSDYWVRGQATLETGYTE